MTGREAAEEEERDRARQRRREDMNAVSLTAAENASLVAEYWLERQNAIAGPAQLQNECQSHRQPIELNSTDIESDSPVTRRRGGQREGKQ
jgi:hypothetical protein